MRTHTKSLVYSSCNYGISQRKIPRFVFACDLISPSIEKWNKILNKPKIVGC